MIDNELRVIVETAIDQTEKLVARGDVPAEVAMRGLEKLGQDLRARWPQHEQWIRSIVCGWLRGHAN